MANGDPRMKSTSGLLHYLNYTKTSTDGFYSGSIMPNASAQAMGWPPSSWQHRDFPWELRLKDIQSEVDRLKKENAELRAGAMRVPPYHWLGADAESVA